MPNKLLLENPFTTSFTDNTGVIALTQLVSSQKKLIISKLILAFTVVTFEPNLVQVFILKLV